MDMEVFKIPVVLFVYARPQHLRRTLGCLKENRVPLIYAFSDGAQNSQDEKEVAEVRQILRQVDWCEMIISERKVNLGLGRSILAGVSEVLNKHEAAIISEDDLICVPGTYNYLCAALRRYRSEQKVMSVTGWTHPAITPSSVTNQPYFDGRAECWCWGTWARAWKGMDTDAKTLMKRCRQQGIDIYSYGADLVEMAETELRRNIWAVRFLYWHILNRGLCLRPPWGMVEHIGFDTKATNARTESWLKNPPLKPAPTIPEKWPEALENPECPKLWQKAYGRRLGLLKYLYYFGRRISLEVCRRRC